MMLSRRGLVRNIDSIHADLVQRILFMFEEQKNWSKLEIGAPHDTSLEIEPLLTMLIALPRSHIPYAIEQRLFGLMMVQVRSS